MVFAQIQAPIRIKQMRNILFLDTRTGIFYLHTQMCNVAFACAKNSEPYGAFLGVLHSIREHIGNNLANTNIITPQLLRQILVHFHYQAKVRHRGSLDNQVMEIMNHATQLIFLRNNLHFARLNLRGI